MTTYANPGAVADVPPTPNKIEETWGNAIRDRVVNNYANTTDRDADITAPVLGQTCYVAGVGFQIYAGPTDGWRAPWNLSWGRITSASITSDSAAFTSITDVSGLSVTFTALTNRRYRCQFSGNVESTVAGDLIRVTIAGGGGTVFAERDATIPANNGRAAVHFDEDLTTLSAGSNTLKIQAARISGSGTTILTGSAHNSPRIRVTDDGPNGNPS